MTVAVLAGAALVAGPVVVQAGTADALASSTITTQGSSTVSLGATISDTATVHGNATNGSPTGTVMFYACQTGTTQTLTPGACSNVGGNHVSASRLTAAAGDTSTAGSGPFSPTSAGTWCFSATYGGDTNYATSADNTTSGNLDANECVLVQTESSTFSSVTTPPNVTLGPSGTVIDTAEVTGNTLGGKPTGTVVFYVCQTGTTQTQTDGACPATGTPEDAGESLQTGSDDASTAPSSAFLPTSPGTWCFSALYEGNANYSAEQDNTSSGNLDANGCVFVATATAAEASTASAGSVTLGPSGSVSDSVTLTGNSLGGSPTGTVAFYACQTGTGQTLSTGPCPATGTPVDASESLSPGSGDTATASSVSFVPDAGGTWCFSVSYGGDTNYSAGSDNTSSGNLDANECFLVTTASSSSSSMVSSASVTIGPSGSVSDTATVTGNAAGGPPSGSVAFYACQTGTTQTLTTGPCPATGTPEDATAPLSSASSDSASATSTGFLPTSTGTWCLSVAYAGDGNYQGSSDNTSSGNLDPAECVLVTQAASSTATVISASHITAGPGGSVTDHVTVTGNTTAGPPTGTVDFYVCGPETADALCASTATAEGTPALAAAGSASATATSSTFSPATQGVYCFAAVYVPAGGANYTGSSDNQTGTLDTNECVSVAPEPYTITSANHATFTVGKNTPFTVTTARPAGTTPPRIKKKGALPRKVKLVNDHNGEATLSGIAIPKKVGTYSITITATFGTGKKKHVATQAFTLHVVS
ncbi:MAG TPA: hypothetical protein VMB72_06440 [Acidimicrobiales bacterium]|nr:hypothetical protein [Acidimicrobiales bacterium]